MARILYGVQGNGRGHAVRALTIARHYPQHEFLFVSHTDGIPLLGREFRVVECPNPELPVQAHRVATLDLTFRNLRFLFNRTSVLRRVLAIIDTFKPDIAITDYEHLVPIACKKTGIPCLSIDHQHIVTHWNHRVPLTQLPSYVGANLAARWLFSNASDFLVVSFFEPAAKCAERRAILVPPLLRESVIQRAPSHGKHILAYQSVSTFRKFLPFLQGAGRPVVVYGFNSDHRQGNLTFRKYSEGGFLDDLASCSYVVCGGGHTLISEALFFGKPLLSFPISNLFEQFLNAWHVEKSGYGRSLKGFNPKLDAIPAFESRLDRYRENIKNGRFCGNAEIFSLLDHFVCEGSLPDRI